MYKGSKACRVHVLHDSSSADSLWTLHALDPLYMLSQSVLAMYSLLNIIKSVVASRNIFLGSPGRKLSFNWKVFRGAHA